MIDTITLAFNKKIKKTHPFGWLRSDTKSGSFINHGYRRDYSSGNGAVINCCYWPQNFGQGPVFWVTFSVPKLLTGSNSNMICDIRQKVAQINQILNEIDEFPPTDISSGILRRVDVCYNHNVGEHVDDFVLALSKLEYDWRETTFYRRKEVLYENKEVSTKFYDKYKECKKTEMMGVLRQETTLRAEVLQERFANKAPTISDLSPERLASLLRADLQELNLLDRSIGTADYSLKTLCNKYGRLAGIFYYGCLHANISCTKEMIEAASNAVPNTMDRRLHKIVEAGLPLTITEGEIPLPPLTIDFEYALERSV